MNAAGGYVRLFRRLWDHPAFRNHAEAGVFAWMVSVAQWQPHKLRTAHGPVDLLPGQLLFSERRLAEDFGMHRNTIRALLHRMVTEGIITLQRDHRAKKSGTIAGIVNYAIYQQLGLSIAGGTDHGDGPFGTSAGPLRDHCETKNKDSKTENPLNDSILACGRAREADGRDEQSDARWVAQRDEQRDDDRDVRRDDDRDDVLVLSAADPQDIRVPSASGPVDAEPELEPDALSDILAPSMPHNPFGLPVLPPLKPLASSAPPALRIIESFVTSLQAVGWPYRGYPHRTDRLTAERWIAQALAVGMSADDLVEMAGHLFEATHRAMAERGRRDPVTTLSYHENAVVTAIGQAVRAASPIPPSYAPGPRVAPPRQSYRPWQRAKQLDAEIKADRAAAAARRAASG